MQIKTITTVAGVNEIDFGNDDSQTTAHFYWFKNLSDSTLYVSAMPDPVVGEDNVAELSAKGAASVETDEGKVYVLGAGKVEIHRTNSKFCPFELPSTGSGGGGTVDAYTKTESDSRYAMKNDIPDSYTKTESDTKYAKKSEIPTSLPANGGNSDTTDAINGLIILNSENIVLRTIEGGQKWVCMANTVPNSAGYITAGIWFKNNLSYSIPAQIIAYAAKKAPIIQAGYGTGTMKDMFEKGSGREWYANTTLETTPTPISMIVPSGKTGYFGFNRTTEGQEAYINDVKAYTTKDVRLM